MASLLCHTSRLIMVVPLAKYWMPPLAYTSSLVGSSQLPAPLVARKELKG